VVRERNTKQKELLREKLEGIDTFFSAVELLELAKKESQNLGIATVYRFLNELKNNNSLYSYRCNRRTVYSRRDRNHCHFVCEKTGKVTHFNIDSLDFLRDKIPGSIKSFQLDVRGVCNDCGSCTSKMQRKKQ